MSTDDVLDIIDTGLQRIAVTVKTAVKKTWDAGMSDPKSSEPETLSVNLRSYAAKLVNQELRKLRVRIVDLIPLDDPRHFRLTEAMSAMLVYKRDAFLFSVFRYMKYNLEGYIPKGGCMDDNIGTPVRAQHDPEESKRAQQRLSWLT